MNGKLYWFKESMYSEGIRDCQFGSYRITNEGSIINTEHDWYIGDINNFNDVDGLEKLVGALREVDNGN